MLGNVATILLSENEKTRGYVLLCRLSSLFLYSPINGMKMEICEFFKSLLEIQYNTNLLNVFYSKVMIKLIGYIKDSEDTETIYLILQILIRCSKFHNEKTERFVIRHDIIKILYPLFSSKSKVIRLYMMKLLKVLIISNTEAMIEYLVANDYLNPVFDSLSKKFKDNLISSTCFEMLNFIASRNIVTLITYIMTKYGSIIFKGAYENNSAMKNFILKYDSNKTFDGKSELDNHLNLNENLQERPEEIKVSRKRPDSEIQEIIDKEVKVETTKLKKYDDHLI